MLSFGSSAGLSSLESSVLVAPDDAAFNTSDHLGVAVTSSYIRFTRSTTDANGYQHCTPGARVRFNLDAAEFVIHLGYTGLVTRMDTYNGAGVVLADGEIAASFSFGQSVGTLDVYVSLLNDNDKLIEVVFPYCASVDFLGVSIPESATVTAPAARASTILVAGGDSITHGFNASGVSLSWPYLLAKSKGWQLKNHGYGSRRVTAADGTAMANLSPSVVTYLIGYNNFVDQTALATFATTFTAFMTAFRSINTTAKVYCLTPLYSPNTDTLTLEDYRDEIRDVVTALADPLTITVEGEALCDNDADAFPDTVHPSDSASAQIAVSLASAVTL